MSEFSKKYIISVLKIQKYSLIFNNILIKKKMNFEKYYFVVKIIKKNMLCAMWTLGKERGKEWKRKKETHT